MASEPEVEQAHLDRTHAAYYALLDAVTGLEFDAGVVVEPAAILAERPNGGRAGSTRR